MSDDPVPPQESDQTINLKEALEERYLNYALSTIMHRALPDVRDGLKPVHRRVLFAMRQLRMNPDSGYKKCARVVGDVIGKYHPHGDQSVYDALVRLAQDFAQRYPLVDGQGNFGNIDGDNAAAMRYTESRMTDVAAALLEALDEDTVDFRETYDGTESEPVVLPANFPNLLANGATGIAVGMATSIPPHNAGELVDAALALVKKPATPTSELVKLVPGPDFPTGGIIVEDEKSILQAYETGRGGFKVRAKWQEEKQGRGYQIVITEIPYQVQKSRLIEKIADLIMAKKLPLVSDIRDESAEDIRLVIEPKSRTIDPVLVMESLFRLTELENRIPLNMNVLTNGGLVPRVIGLKEALQEWLNHRKEVLVRRSRWRLEKIELRLEILDGLLIAFLNLDEVIRIIRFEDDPKAELIKKFKLTENQVEAILNMRLRTLNKLQEIEIRTEHDTLSAERDDINALLASDKLQWKKISGELAETKKKFGQATELGRRRSRFEELPTIDVDLDTAIIEKEPVTIVLSQKGWIRALKGHQKDMKSVTFKKDDELGLSCLAQTTDKLMLFASNGKFYTLSADALPGGRGQGEPVRLLVDLDENDSIIALFVHKPERKLLLASLQGNGFIVNESSLLATTRKGKQVLNLAAGDEALICTPVSGDRVAVIGDNRKMLVFPLDQLNEMTRGRGVRLQRYTKTSGANLSDLTTFDSKTGLQWKDASGRIRTLPDFGDWEGNRASAGKNAPKGFPLSNKFSMNSLGNKD